MRSIGRRRWLIWVVAFFLGVLSVDIVLLVGPRHVEARAKTVLEEFLLVEHSVDKVHLRGWTVVAEGLVLYSKDGAHFSRIAEIPRVELDLDPLAWMSSRQIIREARVYRARLYVELDHTGDLSLADVLRPPGGGENQSSNWPRILLENLEVDLCPQSVFALDEPISIDRVELRPTDEGLYSFSAHASSALFEEIRFVAHGDHEIESVHGEIELVDLHVDRAFADRLPRDLRELWDELRPRGRADLSFEFDLVGGHLDSWMARLELSGGEVSLREPSLSVDSIAGVLEFESKPIENSELASDAFPELGAVRTIGPLVGRALGGDASIEGEALFSDGEIEHQKIDVSLTSLDASDLQRFGRRVVPSVVRHVRGDGRVNVDFVLEGGADAVSRLERIDLIDVDLYVDEVPHPLRGLHGGVVWEDGLYRTWLDGRFGGADLNISGIGGVSGDDPFRMSVRVDGLRVDDATLADLPPEIELALRPYNPRGNFNTRIDFDREPGERTKVRIGVDVRGGSCLYRGFPMTIDDLDGTVTVYGEIHPEAEQPFFLDRLVLQNLRGKHQECDVRVDLAGYRFARPGEIQGQLDLEVISPNLTLTEELVSALPPNGEDMLRSFDLDGSLSTRVRVYHLPHENPRGLRPVEIAVEARVLEPIVIAHRDLPYPLNLRSGVIDYRSTSDRVYLRDLETDPARGPLIRLNGAMIPDRIERRLDMSIEAEIHPGLHVGGIQLEDPTFRRALPEEARTLVESLKSTGDLTGNVRVRYSRRSGLGLSDYAPAIEFSGDLRVENGGSHLGVTVNDCAYSMSIYGQAGQPDNPKFFFSIDVRDLTFRFGNFVVDQARSRVVYGREHPWVRFVRRQQGHGLPQFDETFVRRLRDGQVEETIQIVVDDARIFGGRFEAMAFVDVGGRSDFMLQLRARDLDVAKGSEELFGSNEAAVRGTAHGELLVSGMLDRPSSMRGRGTAMVRDGRLVEVPVGVVFLRNPIFGIADTLEPSQRAVEEVDADFRIEGDRIIFDDYEDFVVATPVQSFAAKGWISFEKKLELVIAPLGAFYGIPGLSQLIGGAFRISLTGALEDPSASLAPYQ